MGSILEAFHAGWRLATTATAITSKETVTSSPIPKVGASKRSSWRPKANPIFHRLRMNTMIDPKMVPDKAPMTTQKKSLRYIKGQDLGRHRPDGGDGPNLPDSLVNRHDHDVHDADQIRRRPA